MSHIQFWLPEPENLPEQYQAIAQRLAKAKKLDSVSSFHSGSWEDVIGENLKFGEQQVFLPGDIIGIYSKGWTKTSTTYFYKVILIKVGEPCEIIAGFQGQDDSGEEAMMLAVCAFLRKEWDDFASPSYKAFLAANALQPIVAGMPTFAQGDIELKEQLSIATATQQFNVGQEANSMFAAGHSISNIASMLGYTPPYVTQSIAIYNKSLSKPTSEKGEEEMATNTPNQNLSGLLFCQSGKLSQTRADFIKTVNRCNGTFSPSVTSACKFMVMGAGNVSFTNLSKALQRALECGVPIINETSFNTLTNGNRILVNEVLNDKFIGGAVPLMPAGPTLTGMGKWFLSVSKKKKSINKKKQKLKEQSIAKKVPKMAEPFTWLHDEEPSAPKPVGAVITIKKKKQAPKQDNDDPLKPSERDLMIKLLVLPKAARLYIVAQIMKREE